MTKEDCNASASDDSDIEIQLPITIKRNHVDESLRDEPLRKRIETAEKKETAKENPKEEGTDGNEEKETLHKTIRERLSKKSGYKPDLS